MTKVHAPTTALKEREQSHSPQAVARDNWYEGISHPREYKEERYPAAQRKMIPDSTSQLQVKLIRFGIAPESFKTSDAKELLRNLKECAKTEPDFYAQISQRDDFKQLTDYVKNLGARRRPPALDTTVSLEGLSPSDGLAATIKALQGHIPQDHQIGIRGGSLTEGLGWMKAGPFGDPRVPESVSTYLRRTGAHIPIFDISEMALNAPELLPKFIDDAMRYGRSGNLAEQCTEYACEHFNPDEVETAVKDLLDLDLDELPFELNKSEGIIMVFSAKKDTYAPSFHRNDPNWNNSTYDYVVTMGSGDRHLRALIPIPPHGQSFPEGAFAVIVTPEMKAAPENAQRIVFDAAFREFNSKHFYELQSEVIREKDVA